MCSKFWFDSNKPKLWYFAKHSFGSLKFVLTCKLYSTIGGGRSACIFLLVGVL